MVIIRVEASNGDVTDGTEKRSLEMVLNDLQQQGLSLFSHQAMHWGDENMLIEVVLMHKEDS